MLPPTGQSAPRCTGNDAMPASDDPKKRQRAASNRPLRTEGGPRKRLFEGIMEATMQAILRKLN